MKKILSFVLLFCVLVGCEEPSPLGVASEKEGAIKKELEITSSDMNSLRDLRAEYTLTNTSQKKATFSFSSACQVRYTIKKGGDTIYDIKERVACAAVITKLTLPPSESETFQISAENLNTDIPFTSGTYTLNVMLWDKQLSPISVSFVVED